MTLADVRAMPKTFEAAGTGLTHESVLRGWACIDKVKELLVQKTPHAVILELIEDMMNADAAEPFNAQSR